MKIKIFSFLANHTKICTNENFSLYGMTIIILFKRVNIMLSLMECSIQSSPGLSPHTRLQWRRGADAPEGFSGAQTVVAGEIVYVGGGSAVGSKIFQYNWRSRAWNTLPECPVMWFGLAQIVGKLTTVGGKQEDHETGRVYQFLPDIQRWQESLPPMPTARSSATVVAHPSSSSKPPAIAVCGGLCDGGVVCNTVEVFRHSSSQWYTAEPLPSPMCGLTSTIVGDSAYLLGGVDVNFSNSKCCFSVSLDTLINKATSHEASQSHHGLLWTNVSDTLLTLSCAASLGSSLVAVGGWDSSTCFSATIHVLTGHGSWERVGGGDLPEPRCQTTAVFLPLGELMVVGGYQYVSGPLYRCTVFFADITE